MRSDAGDILHFGAAALERHQSIFPGARHAVCSRQDEIGRDRDAGAQVARAHDDDHVAGNGLVGEGCTSDDGGSGPGCERKPGKGEERAARARAQC